MLVHPVANLLEMGEGAIPEAAKGIIKNIGKQFTTKGAKPALMQFAELHGPDRSVIKLVLYGREELPASYNGKEIFLTAFDGQRGPSGLKRANYDTKDKSGAAVIEPQLWVYDKADLALEQGGTSEPPPPQQRQTAPPPQQRPAAPPPQQRQSAPASGGTTPGAHGGDDDAIKAVKQKAMQLANLYVLACGAAKCAHASCNDEMAFPTSDIPAAAKCLFIKLERDGMHTQLPTMPITKPAPRA